MGRKNHKHDGSLSLTCYPPSKRSKIQATVKLMCVGPDKAITQQTRLYKTVVGCAGCQIALSLGAKLEATCRQPECEPGCLAISCEILTNDRPI